MNEVERQQFVIWAEERAEKEGHAIGSYGGRDESINVYCRVTVDGVRCVQCDDVYQAEFFASVFNAGRNWERRMGGCCE